jgi:Zn-finger nucleic acid-binding protein
VKNEEMKCPTCTVDLKMADRQGVEIDYCPQCRGVWLDRGELDKIIERSGEFTSPEREREREAPYAYEGDDYGRHPYHGRRKRKSFLGEIFDFD